MSAQGQGLVINVDFGGVLSQHDGANAARGHVSTEVNMPGAVDGLTLLKEQGHKLVLNSFCGKARAQKTKLAINKQLPDIFHRVYFVKDRNFKGSITKATGADVMIDDRLDVLESISKLDPTCPLLLWFTDKNGKASAKIKPVQSWPQIVDFVSTIKPSHRSESSEALGKFVYTL